MTDLTKPISENSAQTNARGGKNIYNSQIPGYIQMLPCYSSNNENLIKLQSLFYTNWLTKDFIEDIKQVLQLMNKPPLSLEIMASTNNMKTIEIIVEKCPQAVLKYSMVSITYLRKLECKFFFCLSTTCITYTFYFICSCKNQKARQNNTYFTF